MALSDIKTMKLAGVGYWWSTSVSQYVGKILPWGECNCVSFFYFIGLCNCTLNLSEF